MAELPALAVRPELHGNTLGRLLLAVLEDVFREAGVKLIAMPALVPFSSSCPRQGMASDGQTAMLSTSEQVSSYNTMCLTCSVYIIASCLTQQALGCTASENSCHGLFPLSAQVRVSPELNRELVRHHIDVPCAQHA